LFKAAVAMKSNYSKQKGTTGSLLFEAEGCSKQLLIKAKAAKYGGIIEGEGWGRLYSGSDAKSFGFIGLKKGVICGFGIIAGFGDIVYL
jgi:hypothetical protein